MLCEMSADNMFVLVLPRPASPLSCGGRVRGYGCRTTKPGHDRGTMQVGGACFTTHVTSRLPLCALSLIPCRYRVLTPMVYVVNVSLQRVPVQAMAADAARPPAARLVAALAAACLYHLPACACGRGPCIPRLAGQWRRHTRATASGPSQRRKR